MLTLKVEVTSGLHAGARWTFDHGIVTLGGDANSEVFLCDEGIPEQCMRLRIFGNRITFEDMAADVRYLGQAGKSTNRTFTNSAKGNWKATTSAVTFEPSCT